MTTCLACYKLPSCEVLAANTRTPLFEKAILKNSQKTCPKFEPVGPSEKQVRDEFQQKVPLSEVSLIEVIFRREASLEEAIKDEDEDDEVMDFSFSDFLWDGITVSQRKLQLEYQTTDGKEFAQLDDGSKIPRSSFPLRDYLINELGLPANVVIFWDKSSVINAILHKELEDGLIVKDAKKKKDNKMARVIKQIKNAKDEDEETTTPKKRGRKPKKQEVEEIEEVEEEEDDEDEEEIDVEEDEDEEEEVEDEEVEEKPASKKSAAPKKRGRPKKVVKEDEEEEEEEEDEEEEEAEKPKKRGRKPKKVEEEEEEETEEEDEEEEKPVSKKRGRPRKDSTKTVEKAGRTPRGKKAKKEEPTEITLEVIYNMLQDVTKQIETLQERIEQEHTVLLDETVAKINLLALHAEAANVCPGYTLEEDEMDEDDAEEFKERMENADPDAERLLPKKSIRSLLDSGK